MPMSNVEEFCVGLFTVGSTYPTVEKCIKVKKDCEVSFWIYGKQIKADELNIVPGENIVNFIQNMKDFESVSICRGGPKADIFPAVSETLCSISAVGLL